MPLPDRIALYERIRDRWLARLVRTKQIIAEERPITVRAKLCDPIVPYGAVATAIGEFAE